ncbi:MAG: hypothetical protein ACO31I_16935 [Prochlorotrichaceae cyanobacterium]|jgi:cystathionine beta-lyase family protein involved in aluminum resistance
MRAETERLQDILDVIAAIERYSEVPWAQIIAFRNSQKTSKTIAIPQTNLGRSASGRSILKQGYAELFPTNAQRIQGNRNP